MRPRRWPALAPLVAWLLAAAACRGEAAPPASAGVPLLGVADSTVFELPADTPAGDSVVTAGTVVSPPRAGAASRPGDSVVAVVSSPHGRISLFALDGRPVSSIAHADAPPRPIGAIAAAASCAHGGLLVVTSPDHRVLAFDSAGALTTRWRMPNAVGAVLGVQCESPNDVLVLADGAMPPIRVASLVRVGSVLYRFTAGGTTVDTLGAFAGRELLRLSSADPGQPPPFGIFSRFVAGPTRIYLASSDQASITQVQVNGRALRSITFVSNDEAVSRAAVDSALRVHLTARRVDWPEAAFRSMADALAKDRMVPPWTSFAIDADENVWVGTNEASDEGSRVWLVFGTDGLQRAKVRTPFDLDVTEVGRSQLLGVRRGSGPARQVWRFALRPVQ